MPLPVVESAEPVEDYAAPAAPTGCSSVESPGPRTLRELVLTNLGGGDSGIVRPCDVGGPSDHHEGRAWDWTLSAADPDDASRADEFLDWLLATDARGNEHATLRRLGLTYVIWDRRIWSTRWREWRAYDPTPGHPRDPHVDHMHISFGWPGARAETSFYRWLQEGEAPTPVGPPAAGPPWGLMAATASGIGVGWLGARLALGRRAAR